MIKIDPGKFKHCITCSNLIHIVADEHRNQGIEDLSVICKEFPTISEKTPLAIGVGTYCPNHINIFECYDRVRGRLSANLKSLKEGTIN